MADFLTDVQTLRSRARQQIDKGPVTQAYGADVDRVIEVCQEALATEIVCVLRYKQNYYAATGLNAEPVAAEFLQHAGEEQQHADLIAARIDQLVSRVVSDFTVGVRDNGVCLLLRRLCCVPVMSRS